MQALVACACETLSLGTPPRPAKGFTGAVEEEATGLGARPSIERTFPLIRLVRPVPKGMLCALKCVNKS